MCNFACLYCYFYNPENPFISKRKLTSNEILTILIRINEYSLNNELEKAIKVIFVGSGEPLLSWNEIYNAIKNFFIQNESNRLKFYVVTNGSLITDQIANEMKQLRIIPSVSLDGSAEIHDKNRRYSDGSPSFTSVMKGIEILRRNNFEIIINSTLSLELINNLELFFDFIIENKIDKVIFGRLVDAPSFYPNISYEKYYEVLQLIFNLMEKKDLKNIEIGNIKSFKRAISGKPDKVCTLISNCCGAGLSNIIYLQRDVYPCGRMFNNQFWKLGDYKEDLQRIQDSMKNKIKKFESRCNSCDLIDICVKDCILENSKTFYSCKPRKEFLKFLIKK